MARKCLHHYAPCISCCNSDRILLKLVYFY